MITDHDKALSKAKITLMSKPDSVFFTTVCFSLKHIWDNSISTAGASTKEIRFNVKFFMSLDIEEQVFLLLHETMHTAYLHTIRVQSWMCPDRANIAMDHVINLQLIERGFKMPKNGYADPKYKGMAWEEVYKLLPENPGKPMMQDVRPETGTPEEIEQAKRCVEDILVSAAIQSKMAGDNPGAIPGDIQIFLNGLLNPKLPWTRLLQKYLQTYNKSDYSFKKLNRRFFPKHYLPSLWGKKLMDLAIAVDISGSVSDSDFHQFVSEIATIFRMMAPDKITLIQFDTCIKSIDEVKSLKELTAVKFIGRGGTAISPVITWANAAKPQLLMVFTDGEFRFHGDVAKSETLWLIHNNEKFTPPFGRVIHYHI
jgi:predicted metal-dependent peptidase